MTRQLSKRYLILAGVCVLALLGLVYYYFFTSFTGRSVTKYVYVDQDDNFDSLVSKLKPNSKAHTLQAFCILALQHPHPSCAHGPLCHEAIDGSLHRFPPSEERHAGPR